MAADNTAEQLEQVWGAMLSQATGAGMTREEIARMTIDTATHIVGATFRALFPVQEEEDRPHVVPSEVTIYGELLGAVGFLEACLSALEERKPVEGTAEGIEDTGGLPPAA